MEGFNPCSFAQALRRTLQNVVRFNWAEKAWGPCVLLTGVQSQAQTQASYQTSLNLKEIHDPSFTGLLGQLKETVPGTESDSEGDLRWSSLEAGLFLSTCPYFMGLFPLLSASLAVNAQALCQGMSAWSTLSISLQVNPLSCHYQGRLPNSVF